MQRLTVQKINLNLELRIYIDNDWATLIMMSSEYDIDPDSVFVIDSFHTSCDYFVAQWCKHCLKIGL